MDTGELVHAVESYGHTVTFENGQDVKRVTHRKAFCGAEGDRISGDPLKAEHPTKLELCKKCFPYPYPSTLDLERLELP